MKILLVCNYPLGGIRTFIKYHYKYFHEQGADITIIANDSTEKDAFVKDMNAINVEVVWTKSRMGRNILILDVIEYLKNNKIDFIHSHGYMSGVNASIANIFFNYPHVLTMHGIIENKYFEGFVGKFKKLLFGKILRTIPLFHGVGHDVIANLYREFPGLGEGKQKSIVIPSGVNAGLFHSKSITARDNLRNKLGVESDAKIYGYFGRFMPEKGFKVLVNAIANLKSSDRIRNFYIVAAGSGDYEREYKKEVKEKNLNDVIKFIPFTRDIAELMKGCDAVIIPSLWEAYPLLPLEVLCAGIPLIASNCVGLREAVSDTPAIVVEPDNSELLAQAIIDSMERPNLKEIFNEFKDVATTRYDASVAARRMYEAFEEFINSRGNL